MSATFRNMRHSDEMVDVVLAFEETRVKCHRLVLAASCDYFRRMFQTDMQERDAGEISIKDVSSTTGLLLVEYLYSGNIQISAENAQELLAVSDRLLLTKLKKNVEKFLCGQVASTNCVSFKNLARLYGLDTLIKVTHGYLNNHWQKLIDMESEIDELTEDDLIALLTTYGSDEGSFLLLQKWAKQWRTLPPMNERRYYHSSICNQDEFMVIGGRINEDIYLDSVECLNLKTLKWSQFPDLPEAQCLNNAVCIQKQLFVLGGWISITTVTRDVYKFDSAERAWQALSPLPETCEGVSAVSFASKIFVIGGQFRRCMQYDPCTDIWVQLQRPQFEHIYGPALAWRDKIVLCGGKETDSIEEYDPQSNKWSTWNLKMPNEDYFCFALTIKRHK
ncbi:hypothetical protein CAPTEDRAFT_137498 [Capitella teleta]|uniref:BTB domain-containing protein n=1 Tax=Capitella teleta TaxID=283909 RepID=R7TIS2_CAPTE|nr:hypothetical protein CAPTEDRAFT_137498 [Capitella teleta]|eukprot:ELT93362.1 hypothetical protein CAPTEDRAFT_137498 [Capitella teleta]